MQGRQGGHCLEHNAASTTPSFRVDVSYGRGGKEET